MQRKLKMFDLLAIAQAVGATAKIRRVSNETRFELTEERRKYLEVSGISLRELDKFKESEFVWAVQGFTMYFFDNYARALHMALSVCRIRINEKYIDFEDNSLPESYEANANRTR